MYVCMEYSSLSLLVTRLSLRIDFEVVASFATRRSQRK